MFGVRGPRSARVAPTKMPVYWNECQCLPRVVVGAYCRLSRLVAFIHPSNQRSPSISFGWRSQRVIQEVLRLFTAKNGHFSSLKLLAIWFLFWLTGWKENMAGHSCDSWIRKKPAIGCKSHEYYFENLIIAALGIFFKRLADRQNVNCNLRDSS